ncbi:hypothetical protein H113_07277 [Trichophyton rubrum MR1459]|uniref:Uncharacterized protein n=1 Tax=Trichophyton soudanense CBS 452.61 TaxID=1215331 RepID=A0A022XI50_TRISD|nr:hypothetical protein H100_07240 [Trichophyton rubrum MR850]EZF38571.1 hypothetical protein H102_07200 [Trichophyton rubrum CBS 100081]EZF59744.1 hypothetical protein H104_07177 [Trichophyton rubrum CBS 289.86]EZF70425.1 hypothetical protein H105_07238 [Trichophyton soudanense CBS 452.61]EZF81118.1 hypothetical protein H110_07222 [Trichophyton rubrum MR1448]EZF91785.1 hypothetical protein H113_07277 [Trichophyton rubrum MR1459]
MQQWVYYVSPEVNAISQYPTILAVCISLTFVMTVVVCLRIWVRAVWKKSFGVDDAVIVSSACVVHNSVPARSRSSSQTTSKGESEYICYRK